MERLSVRDKYPMKKIDAVKKQGVKESVKEEVKEAVKEEVKEPVREEPKEVIKKVISNILIELYSRDPAGDTNIIKNATGNFRGEVIDENPLSIKLIKSKVSGYIAELNKILVFPEGTEERVEEFVKPLKDSDEVIIKITFLSSKNE